MVGRFYAFGISLNIQLKSAPLRFSVTRAHKINEKAKITIIEGNATMVLPVMTAALIDRLSKKSSSK
jgi:hypothetical protein